MADTFESASSTTEYSTPYCLILAITRLKISEIFGLLTAESSVIEGADPYEICNGAEPIASIRIDHSRSKDANGDYKYIENNRTILAMHPKLREYLMKTRYWIEESASFEAIMFRDYLIAEGNKPMKDCEAVLFIDIKGLEVASCKEQIEAKMSRMVMAGFTGWNQFKAIYPTKTYGNPQQLRGYCIITFTDDIPLSNRVAIKIALDQTNWKGKLRDAETGAYEIEICRVSWAKKEVVATLNNSKRRNRKKI